MKSPISDEAVVNVLNVLAHLDFPGWLTMLAPHVILYPSQL